MNDKTTDNFRKYSHCVKCKRKFKIKGSYDVFCPRCDYALTDLQKVRLYSR